MKKLSLLVLAALVLPARAQTVVECTPGFGGTFTCRQVQQPSEKRIAVVAAGLAAVGVVAWAVHRHRAKKVQKPNLKEEKTRNEILRPKHRS